MNANSVVPLPELPDSEHALVRRNGSWRSVGFDEAASLRAAVVFPGAFNPLHFGHLRIAETAASLLERPVDFELSIANVDKPALSSQEVARRVQQLPGDQTIWITLAPTFVLKARLFRGACFLIGVDTAERLADVKYYGHSVVRRDESIAEIAHLGCRFLVFGRIHRGRFRSLTDLPLPEALRRLCDEVPKGHFRADISSTQLRRGGSS